MVAADRDRAGAAISPTRLALGCLAAVGIGLLGWLTFLAPPLDGEPVVIAVIPPDRAEPVEPADLAIRTTVDPERELPDDQIGGNEPVRIIDPSADMVESQAPVRLARAPIAALAEATEFGLLPQIADDGRRALQVYARPAPVLPSGPGAPVQIALIVNGLGISASGTSDAIERLPEPVSLAFAPYGTDLQTWVDRARSNGHEVVLQIPMEPFDYPDNDPGPHTLLTTLAPEDNIDRLRWLLGRFTGYVGITNYMGAKLTSSPNTLSPIIAEIAQRGLSYIDDGTSARSQGPVLAREAGTRSTMADIAIAADESRESVMAALAKLEAIAKDRGRALGVAAALPATIDAITDWAKSLRDRGIVLVPASALTNNQTS